MQNPSNVQPTNGATQPVPRVSVAPLYPPGDLGTPGLASISRSLEVGRLLYLLRSGNPGIGGSEPQPVVPAVFLAPVGSTRRSTRELAGGALPPPSDDPTAKAPNTGNAIETLWFPVEDAIGTPSPLPTHPGHLPGVQSLNLNPSEHSQINPSCAIAHLLQVLASVISGSHNIPSSQRASPSTGERSAPLPYLRPNFLTGNAPPPRRHDADAILRPRGGQGVDKPWKMNKKKKSQKNDHDHPSSKQGEEARSKGESTLKGKAKSTGDANSKVQGNGSENNQTGDSSGGKSSGRA
ncbi:unnamed protein product [Tuber aestivum]|uniref:Uncharacterized protein n=1 Tax=Tuber aestivum TaxID=59557 RepID=A0A292QA75_9PEZI|nr:unnamed protein product [Tuber aestivum]